ncbi:MAG: DUF1467 family protein [Rhodospirillales bacterium]
MSLAGGIAVYVIMWWLVFFMILPIGSRAVLEAEDVAKGQDAGAPKNPRILFKMAIATLVSAVVFGLFYWLVSAGYLSLSPSP